MKFNVGDLLVELQNPFSEQITIYLITAVFDKELEVTYTYNNKIYKNKSSIENHISDIRLKLTYHLSILY